MAMLTLRNLHLSYGDPALIDGIDLKLRAGRITVLLGPNGAGKTTVFNLINKFLVVIFKDNNHNI